MFIVRENRTRRSAVNMEKSSGGRSCSVSVSLLPRPPTLLLLMFLLLRGNPMCCAASHEWPTSSPNEGGPGEGGADPPELPMAVYEQKYYLQRLFTRYGQEGHLSLDALQKLLINLGIGEIRLLEDLDEDQDHDHDYDADPNHDDNAADGPHHGAEHVGMEWVGTLAPGSSRGDQSPGPMSRRGNDSSTDGSAAGPRDGERDRSLAMASLVGSRNDHVDAAAEWPSPSPRTGNAEQQRGLARPPRRIRGIREVPDGEGRWGPTETQGRAMVHDYLVSLGLSGDHGHIHEECMNITTLLWNYGMSSAAGINQDQFIFLCPAMLYQIDSRVCIREQHDVATAHGDRHGTRGTGAAAAALETGIAAWGWGFLAITAISLLSLLATAFIPALSHNALSTILGFLVALAVGTLSGDALLHLLPHAQAGHKHRLGSTSDDWTSGLVEQLLPLGKGMVALGGIYLMFLLENLLSLFRLQRGEKKRKSQDDACKQQKKASPSEELELKAHAECDLPIGPPEKVSRSDQDVEHHRDERPHGHHHGHSHAPIGSAGHVANIAWMVIMGDGLHNFTDGLAIGAAFSSSVTVGLSTSIAVLCHEVPHELGDFAVLLREGMSLRRAVFYNLLSALLGYVGMLIGVAVGQHQHTFTLWIFALTAGCFLYVALVNMLPELRVGGRGPRSLGDFLLQNAGLLLGFFIMFLIALFEDSITRSLSF